MTNIIQPFNWPKLMTALEVNHYDAAGQCIYEEKNLPNLWHIEGQQFVLSLAFDTESGFEAPSNYYLGLDNRGTIDIEDTLELISDEPSTNGYARQAVSSSSGFAIGISEGKLKATTGVLTFVASGGSWGPVSNLFLATTINNTGLLIATVALSSTRTIADGESFTVRVGLSLGGC